MPDIQPELAVKRFVASTAIDSTRPTKQFGDLVQEVIQHLSTLKGAKTQIRIEVDIHSPEAIPEPTQRTVLENSKTLKVDQFSFRHE